MTLIDELVVGQSICSTFLVTAASIRQTNTKPPRDYLTVTLSIKNTSMEGRIWNWPGGTVPEINKLYVVWGVVGSYNDKKQLTMTKMELSIHQDLTDYVASIGIAGDVLWESLMEMLQLVENPKLKRVVAYCYGLNKEAILQTSGGKVMHHVGIGGAALHTLEVCANARQLALANEHLALDMSLVVSGALIHDIGKLATYSQDIGTITYTVDGMLLEHIGLGQNMLQMALIHLGDDYIEEIKLLQHIILSHHGELEWGSPVTPKFMEAYIIHWADNISAKLAMLDEANKQVSAEATTTQRVYGLGNREHLTQSFVHSVLNKE